MQNRIYTAFIFIVFTLLAINKIKAQSCAGTWALERPITVDCFSGQYVGQVSGNPLGCPINPTYTAIQTNTFTFLNPVSSFSIDFRSFDGAVQCPRLEIRVNGLFYHLTAGNLSDFTTGPTCGGSFSAITVTSDGYITTATTLSSRGRISISNVYANSVTISSNDGNGTAFTTPFGCTTIPLNLLFFTGKPVNACKALLQWKSGIELNIRNIEVLGSVNGAIFNKVAEVVAKGDNSYYTIETDNKEDEFFRLRINDLDGHYEYSEIIRVKSECNNPNYQIIPNPVINMMDITGIEKEDLVTIKNTLGQTILRFKTPQNNNRFNLQELSSGIYFVQVFNANKIKSSMKVFKK